MFLHALAQRLIVFQHDGAHVFEGTYQNFLEKEGWEDEADLKKSAIKVRAETVENERQTKKIRRQKRSAILTERAKALKPMEQRIEKIENDIISHEEQLKDLTQAMQKATQLQSGAKIVELSQKIHGSRAAIDHLFEELEELTMRLEQRKQDFESRLTES